MRLAAVLLIISAGIVLGFVSARGQEPNYSVQEQNDRTVDTAVLQTKKNAIRSLQILVERAGSTEQPKLLMSLAEIQRDCAEYEFRIAHGRAILKDNKIYLDDYRTLLTASIKTLNRFIEKYTKDEKSGRAYYLRGRAEVELGMKETAAADFKVLVDRYPGTVDSNLAYLALIDLLTDVKDYRGVISYANRIRTSPGDRFYTVVQERKAWAYYYLNDIPSALKFIEFEIAQYRAARTNSRGDAAERDKAYTNASLFYFTALDQKQPGFNSAQAPAYFKTLAVGENLGKMLIHFAYLLRSRSMDNELDQIKVAVMPMPEVLEVDKQELTLIDFENQLNKHRYAQIKDEADRLFPQTGKYLMDNVASKGSVAEVGNRDNRRSVRFVRAVTDGATMLQQDFMTNQQGPQARVIATALASVYGLLLKIQGNDFAKAAKIHVNLAEVEFLLKDYEGAVTQYRWVVENDSHKKEDLVTGKLVADAAIKAISSRYEALSLKAVFPKELQAKAMPSSENAPDQAPEIKQWISWTDDYSGKSPEIDVFRFEGNRLLYSQGHMKKAMERLTEFYTKYPQSKYATSSAALVLDTYVATEDWEKSTELAQQFLGIDAWKKEAFYARLPDIATDSSFKLVEIVYKKKDYKESIEKSKAFIAKYPTTRLKTDALLIAANSALALGDKAQAMGYFSQIKEGLKPEMKSTIALTNVALAEDDLDYDKITQRYEDFLAQASGGNYTPAEIEQYKAKLLVYEYIQDSPGVFEAKAAKFGFCNGANQKSCQHYRALLKLDGTKTLDKSELRSVLARAQSASDPEQAIFAAIALSNPQNLSFDQRFALLDAVEARWDKEDSITKYSLIPHLSVSIPEVIAISRKEVEAKSKLKLAKAEISRRVNYMNDLEAKVSKILTLPWTRIRASSMNELAQLFMDFSTELKALPKPKGLSAEEMASYEKVVAQATAPFETKGLDLRTKAFNVASEGGVESFVVEPIAQAYFRESPDAKANFMTQRTDFELDSSRKTIEASLYDRFIFLENNALVSETSKAKHSLFTAWNRVAKEKSWSKMAFFTNEIRSKKALQSGAVSLIEGVNLGMAGARAEMLTALQEARSDLDKPMKMATLMAMASAYYESYSKLKYLAFSDDISSPNPNDGISFTPAESAMIASGAAWGKTEVTRVPASVPSVTTSAVTTPATPAPTSPTQETKP